MCLCVNPDRPANKALHLTPVVQQRAFSVADYHRMAEASILTEDDRVELIEGRIIVMSPATSRHAACVKRLNGCLSRLVGAIMIVSVQDPVQLDDHSEPQPDVALLRLREDFYATSHPTAADTLLLIEVADTSESYDREQKLSLYARSAIPEVWIVSVAKNHVEVSTAPVAGIYRHVRYALPGDMLSLPDAPNAQIAVSEILG
jgi:Uma2 family endonuclease